MKLIPHKKKIILIQFIILIINIKIVIKFHELNNSINLELYSLIELLSALFLGNVLKLFFIIFYHNTF